MTAMRMSEKLSLQHYLEIAAVVLLGASLRVFDLGGPSLWLDEVIMVVQARDLDLKTLWLTQPDIHPPLYFTIQKLFMLVGDSEFYIRLSSVVFGVLSIWILYALGRLMDGHY